MSLFFASMCGKLAGLPPPLANRQQHDRALQPCIWLSTGCGKRICSERSATQGATQRTNATHRAPCVPCRRCLQPVGRGVDAAAIATAAVPVTCTRSCVSAHRFISRRCCSASSESPEKKCMSGCVRITSRSICSMISLSCTANSTAHHSTSQ